MRQAQATVNITRVPPHQENAGKLFFENKANKKCPLLRSQFEGIKQQVTLHIEDSHNENKTSLKLSIIDGVNFERPKTTGNTVKDGGKF